MPSLLRLVCCVLVVLQLCAFTFAAIEPGKLVFTVMGDWGVKDFGYADVIAKASSDRDSQFTVALGDNFYKGYTTHMGVNGVDDPKWKSMFEDVFTQPFFQKPWYIIAGNHDYDGDEMAQVRYTTSKPNNRWRFPSLYYHFVEKVSKTVSAEFFMLDSQVLIHNNDILEKYGRERDLKQLDWLERKLRASKADWKFVFAHHPIYTSKGSKKWMIEKVVKLMETHKAAMYLNGHVHTFQHLKSPKLHYFNVGGTGIQGALPFQNPTKDVICKYTHPTQEQLPSCVRTEAKNGCKGFVVVTVQGRRKLVVQYITSNGAQKYTAEVENPNA